MLSELKRWRDFLLKLSLEETYRFPMDKFHPVHLTCQMRPWGNPSEKSLLTVASTLLRNTPSVSNCRSLWFPDDLYLCPYLCFSCGHLPFCCDTWVLFVCCASSHQYDLTDSICGNVSYWSMSTIKYSSTIQTFLLPTTAHLKAPSIRAI